jgi:acyl carrier protein
MSRSTEVVRQVLAELRPDAGFEGSTDFVEDGLLDSYDIVMLVSALDKAFSISIDGADIVPENFASEAALVELLRRNGVVE